MRLMSIGAIAEKAGIAASAIRFYEQIGLLEPPQRVSGKRRYDEAVLQKLGVIRLAQQAGLSVAEIQSLLHDFPANTPPSQRWEALALHKIAELDERMANIQRMKQLLEQTLRCECVTLDDCARLTDPAVEPAACASE